MSDLLIDVPVLALGTKIAIVDDDENDAKPLSDELDKLEISNYYFNVDIADPQFPEHPLKDVEIVFMDLYFLTDYGVQFDAYACIEWLRAIVPYGQKYILVIWSRDADDYTDELLTAMASLDITMPFFTDKRAKQSYRLGDNNYDVAKLLSDISIELKKIPTLVHDYVGQIVEINYDENEILINCLYSEEYQAFEVRRFDLRLFDNFITPKQNQFIRIRITNKPGSSTIDFLEENTDLSKMFIKSDPKGLENVEWPKFPDDENNV
ncbi:MAG: hypothetical protein ACLGH8_02215 [Bacteroidia bacterium]